MTSTTINQLLEYHKEIEYLMREQVNLKECECILSNVKTTIRMINSDLVTPDNAIEYNSLHILLEVTQTALDSCHRYISMNQFPSILSLEMLHRSLSNLIQKLN